jgi:diphthine-ammonia ligase
MPSLTSLNVIALLSGGKDSLFSLLHCIQNGHQIIALANLYPVSKSSSDGGNATPSVEGDDINSFMYQTVGYTIIPLYAEALKLPLYRRQIHGKAVNKGQYYVLADHDAPDETEDLIPLLQEIKQNHPQANAISTGAILSTYQRTRVESVALRVGLTPLAYLWQYPALPPPVGRVDSLTGLLDDMEAAGCDARLIKIATAGVKESLLWSRISDPSTKSQLTAGMSWFFEGDGLSLRGAILGEGGEYETLALNGPAPLWKKQIDIDHTSNVVVEDDGGAVRLVFGRARLVELSSKPPEEDSHLVRVPVLLDNGFCLQRDRLFCSDSPRKDASETCSFSTWICHSLDQNVAESIASITVSNLTNPVLSRDITEQTTAILDQLSELVKASSDSTDLITSVVSTTILLRHMSDFSAVNTVYGKRFNHPNPPARVTICCGDCLPEEVLVSISFALTKTDQARISGLHVQSISYWAPANIGPYSQAINVPVSTDEGCREEIVHVAGQIPLVPSSMRLLEGAFLDQAVLSLQHLWRVGQCVRVDEWTHGVAYLADAELVETQRRAKVAWEVWRAANRELVDDNKSSDRDCEEDDLDAWDLKHNHQLRPNLYRSKRGLGSHLHTLPNHNVLNHTSSSSKPKTKPPCPPFLAAQVFSLPRSAPIEWHSLGLARLPKYQISKPHLTASTRAGQHILTSSYRLELQGPPETEPEEIDFFTVQIFYAREKKSSSSVALRGWLQIAMSRLEHCDKGEGAEEEEEEKRKRKGMMRCTCTNMTTYICSQAGHDAVRAVIPQAAKATIIPCRSLWGEEGRRVEVAITGRREI